MKNIHLSVLGSNSFLAILNELEFNNIVNSNSQTNQITKELYIKILFAENLKIKDVNLYLLKNEPIILFLKNSEDEKIIKANYERIKKEKGLANILKK